jgi:hypothetical protein
MAKSRSTDTVLQTGPLPAKAVHGEVLDLQEALNDLVTKIDNRVASVEAAVREVSGHREQERTHLADYQRHLLAGEKDAADASLAEVSKSRDRSAEAIEAVKAHAGPVDGLRALHGHVREEALRLVPVTEAAFHTARNDRAAVTMVLDQTSHYSQRIEGQLAGVLAKFPEERADV